jgi:hypothetical protein
MVVAIAAMAAFDLLYLSGKYLHAISAVLMHEFNGEASL